MSDLSDTWQASFSGITECSFQESLTDIPAGNYPARSRLLQSLHSAKRGTASVTDANGFYFIGTPLAGISMNTEVHQSERLLRGTTNAIVLWKDEQQQGEFTSTATVDKENIIDAVVFSDSSLFDFRTLEMFTSSQANLTANSTFMTGGFSISRCHSRESGDLLGFSFTVPTPGAINNCPMPEIVINEFNVIAFGYDLGEFFEISSLGVPSYPLNNIIVVLYSRQGKIYRTYEINGRRTDSNGLFLLGYDRMKFPAPDMSVFAYNGNYIKNGPNGIALHRGTANDFPQRSRMTDDNLIDAVVYGVDADVVVQDLIDVLTPGKPQAFEVSSLSEADESINRCVEEGVAVYRSAHISPKFPNFCPYNDVKVVINEISLDPETQFIEIWDMGISLSSLSKGNYQLFVNFIFKTIVEYLVLILIIIMDTLYSAGIPLKVLMALCRNSSKKGYINEIWNREPLAGSLVQTLTPQSSPLPSLLLQEDDASISRCFSDQTRTVDVFSVRPNTPKSLNDCPIFETDVIISEINVDQVEDSPDSSDFIELCDGGKGNSSLDGLTLVLFDAGHLDRSYMSVGLDGYRTNAEGYFVIGASTSMESYWAVDGYNIQTSPCHPPGSCTGALMVCIYRAPSMAFTYGSIAEPQSVVDALVYSLTEDSAVTLETKLTPGYPTFHQRSDYSSSSISRCYGNNRRNPTKFGLADPSPGKPNNCSSATKIFKNIIINEVNIEQASVNSNTEFIELYDLGVGGTSLDGLSLIFFDGDNQDRSYFEVDLNGERTNPDGFFTIGRANAVYIPDKVINYNFLQDGPDAIVLYLRSISDFPRATTATLEGAVDVLVYGSNSDVTSTLIEKLVLGQIQINEQQYHLDGKGSLSRCLSNETMIQSAFVTSYLTPGREALFPSSFGPLLQLPYDPFSFLPGLPS
ncbi:hypothetical protein BSL78_24038 [Apostichopus japonicus]|uniref:Uncharacterized protein n=1 Tax=Stichopus japonicus TaxID=307972 RepID=A0A2G8JTR0_STIJA|nr:hypothetical protein BSL78_24038 [Apostichopus japonicus]